MKVFGIIAAATFAASASTGDVAAVDLNRYLGTWYEVARFDSFFERGCVGVQAIYARGEGSDIQVTNVCRKGTLDGQRKEVKGKAWVPDAAVPGKMKVQFFWPFSGDYWVLEVGDNYEYAVVGDSKKSNCWILSRTTTLSSEVYAGIVDRLKGRGYDTTKLMKVLQPEA